MSDYGIPINRKVFLKTCTHSGNKGVLFWRKKLLPSFKLRRESIVSDTESNRQENSTGPRASPWSCHILIHQISSEIYIVFKEGACPHKAFSKVRLYFCACVVLKVKIIDVKGLRDTNFPTVAYGSLWTIGRCQKKKVISCKTDHSYTLKFRGEMVCQLNKPPFLMFCNFCFIGHTHLLVYYL